MSKDKKERGGKCVCVCVCVCVFIELQSGQFYFHLNEVNTTSRNIQKRLLLARQVVLCVYVCVCVCVCLRVHRSVLFFSQCCFCKRCCIANLTQLSSACLCVRGAPGSHQSVVTGTRKKSVVLVSSLPSVLRTSGQCLLLFLCKSLS